MSKLVDYIKVAVNFYFKLCGYLVFGFEWLVKKAAHYIWIGIKVVAKFLYKYIFKYIIWFIKTFIYNYFLRYIIIGIVWFSKNVMYKFILRPFGVVIGFIFRYPPLSWVKRFVLVPIVKYVLKPLFMMTIHPVYTLIRYGYKSLPMEKQKALTGLLFTSPFTIGLLGLVVYPLGRIIYMSFNNVIQYQTEYTYDYVGFGNYNRILRIDIDFVLEVQNFIVRVLLYTPVIITLAIIIAMLLNQKIKAKGFFRMIFFLPIIILNGELLANMSNYGGMDINLSFFVMDVITTLVPEFAVDLFVELFGIIIEILWYTGVPILIFLAMLQKVDKSLYEAASIDGANAWSSFWKITLPIISPAITVSIIFIVVFLGNFDGNPINGIINDARTSFDRREGYASAMALIYTFVQILVITILLFISSGQVRNAILGRNRRKKHLSKSQKLALEKKGA